MEGHLKLGRAEQVRYFLWLCSHGKILTRGELTRHHMVSISQCPIYNDGSESMAHALEIANLGPFL
ncbi:conserved hypothetical protein [Ricinus communis]|uniref:Reverse transcriptase zinc-binding domain-containing protein n=1 Tax=Ricinus communis TaxID=3988 RepID=B9RX88_RICCO|nr:conserved hypothetical protein [Ricinus communis]